MKNFVLLFYFVLDIDYHSTFSSHLFVVHGWLYFLATRCWSFVGPKYTWFNIAGGYGYSQGAVILYIECRPFPSFPDFGDAVVLSTFSNLRAAAGIARSSQLSSSCQGRRQGPSITVQIIAPPPLSSSYAGQDAVLARFSTAFGLYGYINWSLTV